MPPACPCHRMPHKPTCLLTLHRYIPPTQTQLSHQPPLIPSHLACTEPQRTSRLRTRTASPTQLTPPLTTEPPPTPAHINLKAPTAPIKGALLNTWSLPAHATEIHDLIIRHDLDILALTETWLHPAAGPALALAIPSEYSILREDRPHSRGGGVALIHKTNLSLRMLNATPLPNCEALTAKLAVDHNTTITLLLIYRPPDDNSDFEDNLIQLIVPALKSSSKFLVLGDLNLGLHDPKDQTAASLDASLLNLGFTQNSTTPTHKHGRTLDWITSLNTTIQVTPTPCPWSDHLTLLFTLTTLPKSSPPQPEGPPIWSRNMKKVTTATLTPLLSISEQSITSLTNPDDIVNLYNATLAHALDTAAPLRPTKPRYRPKNKPWFTRDLRTLLTKKRSLEALWSKNPTPDKKLAYTAAAKDYKLAIITAKAQSYNTRIKLASNDTKELFKILRELENPTPTPDTTVKNDTWCTNIQNALNTKTATLHAKILAKQKSITHSPSNQQTPPPPTAPPFSFKQLSETEVLKVIKGLKPSPCKGDICPAHIVKDCTGPLLPIITHFINTSFATSSVPASIKEAWITPLLKKITLDPDVPTNYRPITTVPFLLKILDRAAYLQIRNHLETHQLLGTRQSGFRPGHGTETALLDLKIQLDRARDKGCLAALLLLDLSAAFDLVHHNTLCHHLITTANFSPDAVTWISSFLSERTSKVFAGPNFATATPVTCGVPQGSCVSPTLFNVYMKPLFSTLDKLGITYTNFADDTQILIPLTGNHRTDTATINNIYEVIQAWMAKHHLCLNDDKTELLIVGPASKLKKLPAEFASFTIAGTPIEVVKSVKTLGVHLDAELNFTTHVNSVISSSSYHLKLLNQAKPYLSEENCSTIARAVIGAKLDYCNILLAGTSQRNIKKLQVLQNNAARIVKGLSKRDHISQARRDLHWLPVQARIDFKTLSITHRCLSNSAPAYLTATVQRKTNARHLRSSDSNSLAIPRFNAKRAGGISFPVIAPTLWNNLPSHLRGEPSYWRFRRALKTHLFQ